MKLPEVFFKGLFTSARLGCQALLLALAPVVAWAQASNWPEVGKYIKYFPDVAVGNDTRVSFTVLSSISIGPLMGEPVVYCVARWSLDNVTLSWRAADGRPVSKSFTRRDVPDETWRKSTLWTTLRFPVDLASGETVAVACDPGVMGPPGGPASFNVPGSPAWGDLFYRLAAGAPSYMCDSATNLLKCERSQLKADEAKTAFKNRFRFAGTMRRPATGFSLDAGGTVHDSNQYYPIRLGVDVSAIRAWVEEREYQVLEQRKAELASVVQKRASSEGPGTDPLEASFDAVATSEVQAEVRGRAQQIERLRADSRKAQLAEQQRATTLGKGRCVSAGASSAEPFDAVIQGGWTRYAECTLREEATNHCRAVSKGVSACLKDACGVEPAKSVCTSYRKDVPECKCKYENCRCLSFGPTYTCEAYGANPEHPKWQACAAGARSRCEGSVDACVQQRMEDQIRGVVRPN